MSAPIGAAPPVLPKQPNEKPTPIISIKSMLPPELKLDTPGKQPAVFLDRDGVINTTVDFVNTPEDLDHQLIAKSVEAIVKISRATPVKLVVVTNQGGVGEGKMTDETARAILERLAQRVNEAGGRLDAIYYAPNGIKDVTPQGEVSARKPEGGMILKAATDFGPAVDLADSFMVGDMVTDFGAGKSASAAVTTVGVRTGYASVDFRNPSAVKPDVLFDDLNSFADWFTSKYAGGAPAQTQAELLESARSYRPAVSSVEMLINRASERLFIRLDHLDELTADRLIVASQRGVDVRVVLSPGRRLTPFEVNRLLVLTDGGVDLKVTRASALPVRAGVADGVAFAGAPVDPVVPEAPPQLDEDAERISATVKQFEAELHDAVTFDGEGILPPERIKVHTFPESNAGVIIEAVNAAKSSIDLSVYQLTDRGVIAALEAAVRRGVKVRVMLEPKTIGPNNFPAMAKRLQAAGIEVKATPQQFDTNYNVDHAKFLIVDGRQLMLGSGNLVRQGLGGNHGLEANNRDFWVEDTRATVVGEAKTLFEADWNEQPTNAADFPTLVVTPDDASSDLSALARQATKRLWVTNQSLSEPQVIQDLIDAKARGVDVKVLLGAFQRNAQSPPSNDRALQELLAAGVEVQYFTASYLHAKTIISDDRAFIGSQNFTAAGMLRNRDLGAIYDDGELVRTMASVFHGDWANPGPQPAVAAA